jgi:aldehyde dehydrogenase (NAD+)
MKDFLEQLNISSHNHGMSTGLHWLGSAGDSIVSVSPVDGQPIASVFTADRESYDAVVSKAEEAFTEWRKWPAPKRGDIVRQVSNQLRRYKEPLGKLVSWEMGKSLQEGMGEVQEMIDICDFAVGLSRQLYGLTMHSERPGHRMYEFSCCCLELECRPCLGMRGCLCLETF